MSPEFFEERRKVKRVRLGNAGITLDLLQRYGLSGEAC